MSAGGFLLSQKSCFKVGAVNPHLAQQYLLPMLKEPKQLCSEKRGRWGCFHVLRYNPQGVWLPAGIRPLVWAETQQRREPASVACVNAVLVTKINTHTVLSIAGHRPCWLLETGLCSLFPLKADVVSRSYGEWENWLRVCLQKWKG